jgi:hypothetical protein
MINDCDCFSESSKSIREINKRLRGVYEDSGHEYGADATTPEEIRRRSKVATSLRNKKLAKVSF